MKLYFLLIGIPEMIENVEAALLEWLLHFLSFDQNCQFLWLGFATVYFFFHFCTFWARL